MSQVLNPLLSSSSNRSGIKTQLKLVKMLTTFKLRNYSSPMPLEQFFHFMIKYFPTSCYNTYAVYFVRLLENHYITISNDLVFINFNELANDIKDIR